MMNKLLQKKYWIRAYNRFVTIISTSLSEHSFKGENGERILYVLKRSKLKSDTLLVCFPACSDKPKYNYVGTLKDIPCHKLFLKDDASEDRNGNYLIGGGYNELTIKLIQQHSELLGAKRLIFVGSSKGGYSALNFSFFFPNVNVVIAAPQYRLGNYLSGSFKLSLKAIIGEITEDGKQRLNTRLKNIMKQAPFHPECVYLHVSKKEHTWADHCEEMVADLQKNSIKVEFDFGTYTKHDELIYFFPKYLKETINKLLAIN